MEHGGSTTVRLVITRIFVRNAHLLRRVATGVNLAVGFFTRFFVRNAHLLRRVATA